MHRYLVHRLLQTLVMLFVITTLVFFLLRMIPGDPAEMMMGEFATDEQVEAVRQKWGLDRPLYEQFVVFLKGTVRGDLGPSRLYHAASCLEIVLERMPATFHLAIGSLFFALCVSFPLGIISGLRPGGRFDRVVTALTITAQSIPLFWLGILLILLFAVRLRWLPAFGYGTLRHLILPSITLGTFLVPLIVRLTRAHLIEQMGQDYVRTARSKGLPERQVVIGHALRNAMIPVITVIGLQIGGLLGGAVVTETLFSWPGVGQLLANSVFQKDYNVVQAAVIIVASIYAVVNLIVDLLYGVLDPRIRNI